MLESVQRRWTREITVVQHLNYEERLKAIGLYSVYGRMLRVELVKVWKCFHAGVDLGLAEILERAQYAGTRGHEYKLAVPVSRSEVGRRRFGARRDTIEIWNSLPSTVVESNSIDTFKRLLDIQLDDKLYKTV